MSEIQVIRSIKGVPNALNLLLSITTNGKGFSEYNSNSTYTHGDFVYRITANGVETYRCIVTGATGTFKPEQWSTSIASGGGGGIADGVDWANIDNIPQGIIDIVETNTSFKDLVSKLLDDKGNPRADITKINESINKVKTQIETTTDDVFGDFLNNGFTVTFAGTTANIASGKVYIDGVGKIVNAGTVPLTTGKTQYIYLKTDGSYAVTDNKETATGSGNFILWEATTSSSSVTGNKDLRDLIQISKFARSKDVVMKEAGKGLSTNDFTSEYKEKINTNTSSINEVIRELNGKVDVVEGKGLSTNDFTNQYVDTVDDTKKKMDDIYPRLNTVNEVTKTLVPGIQRVDVKYPTPVDVSGIRGRTLINIFYKDGLCEDLTPYTTSGENSGAEISLSDHYSPYTNRSIRLNAVSTGTDSEHYVSTSMKYNITKDQFYVLIGMVRAGTPNSIPRIRLCTVFNDTDSIDVSAYPPSDKNDELYFRPIYALIKPQYTKTVRLRLQVHKQNEVGPNVVGNGYYTPTANNPEYAYFHSIRMYQVSEKEYNRLAVISATDPWKTGFELNAKYPYTEGIVGVQSPYIINYGQNLIPPIYEWYGYTSGNVYDKCIDLVDEYSGRYTVTKTANESRFVFTDIKDVQPNQTYTVDPGGAWIWYYEFTLSTGRVNNPKFTNQVSTITMSNSPSYIRIHLCNIIDIKDDASLYDSTKMTYGAKDFTFKNMRVILGSTLPEKLDHQNFQAMSFETELMGHPVEDDNADNSRIIQTSDGSFATVEKYIKLRLDDSIDIIAIERKTNYVAVRIQLKHKVVRNWGYFCNHVGQFYTLVNQGTYPAARQYAILDDQDTSPNSIIVSFPNEDTGWGNNYTPNNLEVKAFLRGWKMGVAGEQVGSSQYNGTGTKVFTDLVVAMNRPLSTDAANNISWSALRHENNRRISYNYVFYKVSQSVVTPIETKGEIHLEEGINHLRVGSGLIVQELIAPQFNNENTHIYLNGETNPESKPLFPPSDLLAIYKNGRRTQMWNRYEIDRRAFQRYTYGSMQMFIHRMEYDSTSDYTLTYMKYYMSPPPLSVLITLPNNEKTIIHRYAEELKIANERITAIENSRALDNGQDTLMLSAVNLFNGAVIEDAGTAPFVRRLPGNYIVMQGSLRVPNAGSDMLIMQLPRGYRPAMMVVVPAMVSYLGGGENAAVKLIVEPNGRVTVSITTGVGWLRLDTVKFVASRDSTSDYAVLLSTNPNIP